MGGYTRAHISITIESKKLISSSVRISVLSPFSGIRLPTAFGRACSLTLMLGQSFVAVDGLLPSQHLLQRFAGLELALMCVEGRVRVTRKNGIIFVIVTQQLS